jgi:hypothetical protein
LRIVISVWFQRNHPATAMLRNQRDFRLSGPGASPNRRSLAAEINVSAA